MTVVMSLSAGIFAGGLAVLFWKKLGLFGNYEITPGFIHPLLAIDVVSKITSPPGELITKMFDETEWMMKEFRN